MPAKDDAGEAARLPTRIALISIAGFWALYFVILTMRALVVYYPDHIGLGSRALVAGASMAITVVFYLLIRGIPIRRLGLAIAVAALLAIPAAVAYSTVNFYVFSRLNPHPVKAKGTRPPAPTTMSVGPRGDDYEMTPAMEIADQAGNGYFSFASWAALYLALCYAAEVGRLGRRAAKLEAAARSAELRALRYQVNPHFLFNTLNSLSSLVMIGQADEAERMILNLSTFFRSSLVGDPTEDVRLEEEVKLQLLYLDIERVRFPDRLRIEVAVPEALQRACVPGLILQPLIENAIKHGVARARRPVLIRIDARQQAGRLMLTVEDDADVMPQPAGQGTGVGLANVRDRLQARFGAQAEARWGQHPGAGFVVTLTMPLQTDGC